MTKNIDQEWSHKHFVVLGLVAEKPSHAYSINQRIEERGMRNWTAIGKSSIYRVILELEEMELVEFYEEEVDNRVRKVYSSTDTGFKLLKNKIYKILNEFIGRNDPDFYMAFSMLPYLTQKEQVEVFSNSLKTIKKHKMELEEMLNLNSKMPLNVRGLFIHPIKILKTDIEFLEIVLDEIQQGGGQIDPKTYDK